MRTKCESLINELGWRYIHLHRKLIQILYVITIVVLVAVILNMTEKGKSTKIYLYTKNNMTQSDGTSMQVKLDEEGISKKLIDEEDSLKRPKQNLILLSSSLARSGSTFTGELLASLPGSIYFFEPDFMLDQICSLESCYVSLLTQIFTCSFNETYINFMMSRYQSSFFLNDDVKVCVNFTGQELTSCMRRFDLVAMCKAAETIVVKTIRLRLSWIEKDLHKFPSHLKVILLVRDPRPVRLSTRNSGWEGDTYRLCRAIETDVNVYKEFKANFPSRVYQINYERLCFDIRRYTREMFSFLGFPDIPNSTQIYFKTHSEFEGREGRVLHTKDNSSQKYRFWRDRITDEMLNEVEKTRPCRRVLVELDLTIFNTLARVRDASNPLFKEELTLKV
ncbi:carbohydrate sulfotransferase 3-like [Oratosquilla oratoria]|uniref:carbohydrate sulfotransferase 3-like n=1 Tax=Oratosquilla oratoria TaxID=337810 RepID=UPI003F76CD2A